MNYAVEWNPSAMEAINRLWQLTSNRDAILRAMWDIEAALRDDPHDVGESRPDDRRITYATPLGVRFEIDDAVFQVKIIAAWAIRRV